MSDICPKCGLPRELCVCESIAREGQRIKVKMVKRRFGKMITLVEGINSNDVGLKEIAKRLKSKFACGGTVKDGNIELQGDHLHKVKKELIALGFNSDTIDVD